MPWSILRVSTKSTAAAVVPAMALMMAAVHSASERWTLVEIVEARAMLWLVLLLRLVLLLLRRILAVVVVAVVWFLVQELLLNFVFDLAD